MTEAICQWCESGMVGREPEVTKWAHDHMDETGHKVEVNF